MKTAGGYVHIFKFGPLALVYITTCVLNISLYMLFVFCFRAVLQCATRSYAPTQVTGPFEKKNFKIIKSIYIYRYTQLSVCIFVVHLLNLYSSLCE